SNDCGHLYLSEPMASIDHSAADVFVTTFRRAPGLPRSLQHQAAIIAAAAAYARAVGQSTRRFSGGINGGWRPFPGRVLAEMDIPRTRRVACRLGEASGGGTCGLGDLFGSVCGGDFCESVRLGDISLCRANLIASGRAAH